MRLTADTITDEQIRDLQDSANRCTEMACSTCHEIWQVTRIVLDKDNYDGDLISSEGIAARIRSARVRCAEILNDRSPK